jgi:hypothetical protein
MRSSVLRELGRLLAGAALLLTACLGAPSAARAECGDYVILGGRHSNHASTQVPPGTMPTPTDHNAKVPAPSGRHGPCRGPTCSGGMPAPLLPPVAPVPGSDYKWASTLLVPTGPGADRGERSAIDQSFRPLSPPPFDIFHPPRFGDSPIAF